MTSIKALFITGPTASGKTALAIEVAKQVGGTIVNADSMQVYEAAPILTAQPSKEENDKVPHLLFGHLNASVKNSVGQWLKQAGEALEAVEQSERFPIFVGGTGLYLEALFRGLATIPDIPSDIKARWAEVRAQGGPGALFRSLLEGDPESASAIGAGDPQRLQRALEVMETTNRSLISFQQENAPPLFEPETYLGVVNTLPREELYPRINQRFEIMLENGALTEVEALVKRDLAADHPLARAIGFPQLSAYLRDETSLDEAKQLAKRDSRRYAKRQMTWYRNRFKDWLWLEDEPLSERTTAIVEALNR